MILISHRGNLTGPDPKLENSEDYILSALARGFEVEIDIWRVLDSDLYLGHDKPTYKTSLDFLTRNKEKFWIHCKDLAALKFFSSQKDFNFFWHQNDDYTLTSKGYIWTYPNKPVSDKNILVIQKKLEKNELPDCLGICSDYVGLYA